MRLGIVCAGRLKEAYWRDAAGEYKKRLSRYAELELVEVADEPAPEKLSAAQRAKAMEREGERLLAAIGPREFVVALCIDGKERASEELAADLDAWLAGGYPRVAFVIGGSLGLSPAVLARADFRLSLSRLTFPHQLARVMLLEQLYRAFKILHGEPYHK